MDHQYNESMSTSNDSSNRTSIEEAILRRKSELEQQADLTNRFFEHQRGRGQTAPQHQHQEPSTNPFATPTNPFLNPHQDLYSMNEKSETRVPREPKLQPTLLGVSAYGTKLIERITAYMSTLPHPIEPIEELISVNATTCSLLISLHNVLYPNNPNPQIGQLHPFIAPLCQDILFAFSLFESFVQKAKLGKVFEPNETGLVRVPRVAWTLVCAGKEGEIRSRCFVEKFRVRVLIDGGIWILGGKGREEVEGRLGLVAERLEGVWRDYFPRMEGVRKEREEMEERLRCEKEEGRKSEEVWDEKEGIRVTCESTDSLVSMAESPTQSLETKPTTKPQSRSPPTRKPHQELWLLRHTPASKTLTSTTQILGIPLKKRYTHTPSTYYVKPLPTCPSDIITVFPSPSTQSSQYETTTSKILSFDPQAQWEIQRLLEARESSTLPSHIKTNWSVKAIFERPRRKIVDERKGGEIEWVLLIEGVTEDFQFRCLPEKRGNPFVQSLKGKRDSMIGEQERARRAAVLKGVMERGVGNAGVGGGQGNGNVGAGAGSVLRHVEKKPVLGNEEAMRRIERMGRDLFVL